MASIVVGMSGRKRAGKDTFAARLVEKHGFTRFAFADPLRQALLALNPIITVHGDERYLLPEIFFVPAGMTWPLTVRLATLIEVYINSGLTVAESWERAKDMREVRELMQRFGTDSIRALDEDFWVRTTATKIDAFPGKVVITDMRFPNEFDAVAQRGLTVRVAREWPEPKSEDLHPSETALDNHEFDYIAVNSGTIEQLESHVDFFAQEHLGNLTPRAVLDLVRTATDRIFPGLDAIDHAGREAHRNLLNDWHNRPGTRVPELVLDQGNFGE